MTTITLATCTKLPALTPSDELLATALRARGADVVAAPWNGDFHPFAAADLTLVRSTWDYCAAPEAFASWIARFEKAGKLLNPPAMLGWNMTKAYLFELADGGAPVPPMERIAPSADAIAGAMDKLALDEAIVKPLIGATASGLSRVKRTDIAGLADAAAILNGEGIVMPVIPEIATAGETSFVFLGGEFSHAVLKRPKAGDIRVQEEYGGSSRLIDVADWAVSEASRILKLCPGESAYARIDAVVHDDRLTLMEAELVEPELFFHLSPPAAARLAQMLLAH